jgi:hypothetical protein
MDYLSQTTRSNEAHLLVSSSFYSSGRLYEHLETSIKIKIMDQIMDHLWKWAF